MNDPTIPIPGITFRRLRDESDYPKIAAVLMASEKADQNERNVTGEDIANAFQRLTNCDPYADIILAEAGSEVIGYSRGWWEDELPTARFYKHNGFLLPGWRRKGIGTILLSWIENRLRGVAATQPAEDPKFFQANTSQHQVGKANLLERAGYQVTRYFYTMVRPDLENIILPPFPEGVELRPVIPEQYRAIWKLIDETSQDEWGYKPLTEDDYQEWLGGQHFQPELWQIAWDKATDQPVGTVCTYIHHEENRQFDRKRGYTEGIGVARAWRRKGLARAMIARSLQRQKEAGMTESALVADSDSQSNVTELYLGCGFQVVNKDTIYRKAL